VLRRAYQAVRLNRGAPGIDEMTFDYIENEVGTDVFLEEIRQQLITKRYRPQAVRRVYIPKADGKQRPLGIPVIADRVVQAAAKIVLEPIFESDFKDFSYGFRPSKTPARRCVKSTSGSTSVAPTLSMRTSSRTSTRFRTTSCCDRSREFVP